MKSLILFGIEMFKTNGRQFYVRESGKLELTTKKEFFKKLDVKKDTFFKDEYTRKQYYDIVKYK